MSVDFMSWTRQQLEAEARRLGAMAPEQWSRDELIAELERLRGGSPSTPPGARGLLRRVVSKVRGALPMPSSPPRPSRPSLMMSGSEERSPDRYKGQGNTAPSESSADRGGRVSQSSADAEEPIPTRTMAGLLAAQGHPERAIAIYEQIAALEPFATDVEQAIAKLKHEMPTAAGNTAAEGRASTDAKTAADAPRHATIGLSVGDGATTIRWQVPASAIARGNRMLEAPGALTLRIVVVTADDAGRCERHQTDLPVASQDGERDVRLDELREPSASVTAAIGVERGGKFVSIAHAAPTRP